MFIGPRLVLARWCVVSAAIGELMHNPGCPCWKGRTLALESLPLTPTRGTLVRNGENGTSKPCRYVFQTWGIEMDMQYSPVPQTLTAESSATPVANIPSPLLRACSGVHDECQVRKVMYPPIK